MGGLHWRHDLGRNVCKAYENLAPGVLLCAGKDDEGVEYASSTASPPLIAEY